MRQPNIVVILIDDMGARDLGCTGSTFYETPNIDRMAAEGVVCSQGYASSAVCSPARASILTGRAPARVGITNFIAGNAVGRMFGAPYHFHLPRTERTIATALREAGYHTWHVGKWHLARPDRDRGQAGGGQSACGGQGSLPTDHGFEVNIGGSHHGGLYHIPGVYFAPWVGRDGSTLPGLEESRPGEYLTDRLTDEAIRLIRAKPARPDRARGEAGDDRPFFLHLSYYAVHTPIVSPPDLVAKYEAKAKRMGLDKATALVPGEPHPALHCLGQRIERRIVQSHAAYAAMIENLDMNVGRLLRALDERGLGDDTLMVFVSDNGGLSTGNEGSPTCNLPLAEGKGWSEEGGLRVPMLWRWPKVIPKARVCHVPMWQCDFYPTFLHAAGLPPEPDRHADGLDVLPTLMDGTPPGRDAFFWHYPHYSNQGGLPSGAIRRGDWKLIEWYVEAPLRVESIRQDLRVALYDLRNDPSESFDRAAERPALVDELRRALHAWRDQVGARMPTPNPYYDDIVAGRIARPNGAGHFPPGALPVNRQP